MLLVEDPSCISVEHSAGSGTVFITRHTWFNRLKAIVSSGSWWQFQPAPHFRISYVGASSQAAIRRLQVHGTVVQYAGHEGQDFSFGVSENTRIMMRGARGHGQMRSEVNGPASASHAANILLCMCAEK